MSGVATPGNLDSFYERLERVEANPTKRPAEAESVAPAKPEFYKKKKPTALAWALTISVLFTILVGFAYAVLPDWALEMALDFIAGYFG